MDDARVEQAVRLIRSGMDGVQAASALGVGWTTLSAAFNSRRISVRELKRERVRERVRALVDDGLTTEQVAERLRLPRSTVVKACRALGLKPENEQTRARRLRREQVITMHKSGVSARQIAEHLNVHLGNVYDYIREHEGQLPNQVRALYEHEGLPMRQIAERLRIGIDEARAALRQSFPDASDRAWERQTTA